MSATTPPALVNDDEPKAAAKNRRMIRDAMLGATAQPMSNAVKAMNCNTVRTRSTLAIETYSNCEDNLSSVKFTERSPDQRTERESQNEDG